MLIFGQEAGGNVRTLSLIHSTRVLAVVSVAPMLITRIWSVPLVEAPGLASVEIPMAQLALMAAAGPIGWWAAQRMGIFGATILGPLAVSAALSLAGLLTYRPPAEAIVAAQFFIGAGIGAAYAGVTLRELKRDVTAGLGFCLVLGAITLLFAEAVTTTRIAPPLEAFLAFSPGGQSEMVLLTLMAGADLPFVVTHHIMRLVLVIICAPIFAGYSGARSQAAESSVGGRTGPTTR